MRRAVIGAAVAAVVLTTAVSAQQIIYPTPASLTGNEYVQLAYPSTLGPLYAKVSQLWSTAAIATNTTVGTVKPDTTTITVAGDGTISTGVQPIVNGGTNSPTARGAAASLSLPFIPKITGASASHSGDTNEAILNWVNVPAGAVGANGCVELNEIWAVTGNANTWIMTMRVVAGTSNGTLGGTILQSATQGAGTNSRSSQLLCNTNDAGAQIMMPNAAASFTASTNALATSAIDTTAAWTISINAKVSNGSDSIALRHFDVSLLNGS